MAAHSPASLGTRVRAPLREDMSPSTTGTHTAAVPPRSSTSAVERLAATAPSSTECAASLIVDACSRLSGSAGACSTAGATGPSAHSELRLSNRPPAFAGVERP